MSGPPAPGSAARRRAAVRVATSGVLIQLAFGLSFVWGAVAPAVREQAHWSPLAIGAVFSAVPLGYAAGTTAGGWLADRVPPRRLCAAALVLLSLSFVVAFLQPTTPSFVLCYSFLGLGLGGGLALAGTLAAGAQLLSHRMGGLSGLLTAAYAGAAVVEGPIAAALVHPLGWLDTLRLLGGCDVLLVLGALAWLPPLQPAPRPGSEQSPARPPGLLRNRRLARVAGIELLGTPVGAYALAHLALLAKQADAPVAEVALAVPVAAVGNTCGRLLAGVASDHFGAHRPLLAILGLAVLSALGLAVLPLSAAVLPLGLLAGVGFGGPAGLASRLARDAVPEAAHAAFGLVFAAFAVGAFIGPVLGPALGGGSRSWLVLAGAAAASLALASRRLSGARPEAGRVVGSRPA